VKYVRSFLRFWWDFIVGDDWRAAAGLGGSLLLTWLLVRNDINAWWFLPLAVVIVLVASVRREAYGGSG
jgi:hypothetical protein